MERALTGPRVGLPSMVAPPARVAAVLHAATRHHPKDQCHPWWGATLRREPVVPVAGRVVPIRSLIWQASLRRRVPPGFNVVTTCRDPLCIAVKHLCLWPVKRIESRARYEDEPRDRCQRGHDLTDLAVALWTAADRPRRRCRVCALERAREQRARVSWVHREHVRGPDGRYPVCRRGHPLTDDDNVVIEANGDRRCRTCRDRKPGSD